MEPFIVTPNNPEFFAENDSKTIQNAVDYASKNDINKVVIPRFNARTGENKWISDEVVRLPSDMHIVLDNCFMQKADDVLGGFFCSENYTEKIDCRLRNIKITGIGNAVLDGGKPTALNELTAKEFGIPASVNTPILFVNVEHFKVENIAISNQRYWGMRFEFCAQGIIRDIFFDIYKDRRNQDGINLRNGCHDILIENISGMTGDDMIALSAIDVPHTKGIFKKYSLIVKDHDWDIHDVTIRNISGAAIHHPLVALRNHNGAKIYNINIENIKDTEQIHYTQYEEKFNYERYALITVGCNAYYKTESIMGDTFNISVNNVFCRHSYRAVYVQSTLKNCRFANIFASDKCRHIVSVMPDGWASAHSGVTMENVTFENVFFEADKKAPTSILTAEPDLNATVVDFPKMRDCDYVKNLYFNNVTLKNVDCFAEIAESAKDRIEITLGNIVADSPEVLEFHISNIPDAKKWYWGDPDLPQDQI